MKYSRRTVAEVDLSAIEENLKRLTAAIPPQIKKCLVLKTDGYGHGAIPIARKLADKADFIAAATSAEAMEMRQAGISLPILILGYVWEEDYEEMIANDIRFPIFKEEDAGKAAAAARKAGKTAKVHIKVDTGMSRIGFLPGEASVQAVRRIRHLPGLEAEGIFTHFARADETDKTSAEEQFAIFRQFVDAVEEGEEPFPIRHCANSAASMEMPDTWMDMVRIGISLYGIYPSDEVRREEIELIPALSWKSTVVYIKELPAGAGISYGHTCVLTGKRRVATVPVGYGDGYPRTLSGRGYVMLHGKKAPILGRVCMDQMMVDVTDIPEAAEGDTVLLAGRDSGYELPVEDLSLLSGRFPYEFVCDIGKRVPRVYKEAGSV